MLILLPSPRIAQADSDLNDRTHEASETALRPARRGAHTVTLRWQRSVGCTAARASDWPTASGTGTGRTALAVWHWYRPLRCHWAAWAGGPGSGSGSRSESEPSSATVTVALEAGPGRFGSLAESESPLR